MKYTENELEKFKFKRDLNKIIDEIKEHGIEIDWNKYPDYHSLAVLRQVILDHQVLVPGEEPDLTEMTEAVDNVAIEFEDEPEVVVEEISGGVEVEEEEHEVKPDWELINSIEVEDTSNDDGKKALIRKVYLELLFREPDPHGLVTYVQCLKDGMSLANVREAIRHSTEYKSKHGLL